MLNQNNDVDNLAVKLADQHKKIIDEAIAYKLGKLMNQAATKDRLLYLTMVGVDFKNPQEVSDMKIRLIRAGYDFTIEYPMPKMSCEGFYYSFLLNTSDVKIVVKKTIFEI